MSWQSAMLAAAFYRLLNLMPTTVEATPTAAATRQLEMLHMQHGRSSDEKGFACWSEL